MARLRGTDKPQWVNRPHVRTRVAGPGEPPPAAVTRPVAVPGERKDLPSAGVYFFCRRLLRASSLAVRNLVRVSSLIWICTRRQVRL